MRVMSRRELRNEIESFNNAAVQRVDGIWMYFVASDFAARGIGELAQQMGRRMEGLLGNEYRIVWSNNPANHI